MTKPSRLMPLSLRDLRRLDPVGLTKQRTICIDVVASIKRRLVREDLDAEQRAKAVYGLLCWEHLPAVIDMVEIENAMGARDEWDRHRNALERAVRLMFEIDDDAESTEADWQQAYDNVRTCHDRINNYLNEGINHGHSQEDQDISA